MINDKIILTKIFSLNSLLDMSKQHTTQVYIWKIMQVKPLCLITSRQGNLWNQIFV